MTHYEESQKPDKFHEKMITCFCGKPTQHTFVIKTRCAIENRPHYCRLNIKKPQIGEFDEECSSYHEDDKYEFCSIECIKGFKAMIDHDRMMRSVEDNYTEYKREKKQYVCYTLAWKCAACDEVGNTVTYSHESIKGTNTNCPNDCWICRLIFARCIMSSNGGLSVELSKHRCNGCGNIEKTDVEVHHIFDDEQLEQLNKRGY